MNVGPRLRERMAQQGLSQSELARRLKLNQSTIAALASGKSRSSSHLHRIARELDTTSAYLSGETDDPDVGAPPPPPSPRLQHLTMPVAIPTIDALADSFEALLSVSEHLDRGELARELAEQLPNLLRIAGGAAAVQPSPVQPDRTEAPAAPPRVRRERRRA